MERRRALAWAGSIALTASASAIVLGSLVGGFGLGSPPAQETEVPDVRPEPVGVAPPRPAPGGTDSGIATEGTEAQSAPGDGKASQGTGGVEARGAPGSVPAIRRYVRSSAASWKFQASVPMSPPSATASPSDTPAPQRELGQPSTSAATTRAVAPNQNQSPACVVPVGQPSQPTSSSLGQLVATATVAERRGAPGRRDHPSEGSGQHRGAATVVRVDVSGTSSTQLIASVPNQSPAGDRKTAAEEHAVKGRSNNDG